MSSSQNETIYELFNKKVCIKDASTSYILPPLTELFKTPAWTVDDLQDLKRYLNKVKSKLNEQKIEIWSQHTNFTNPAANIVPRIRNEDIKGEFCTQAWCKLYEILSNYPTIPTFTSNVIKTLHVCEAPGGFVAALNHFLKLNYSELKHEWRATTLSPFYEGNTIGNMIIDDRFIQQTLSNWCFGEDNTGNIMVRDNLLKIQKWAAHSVDLVTADGSIDCLSTPDRQEEEVAVLHIAEVVTCLSCLKHGGSFILKMFTFFECSSINLLFLLCCVFQNVHVFKPATSKQGNSEVYVICISYQPPANFSEYLIQIFKEKLNVTTAMFSLNAVPEKFLLRIKSCSAFFQQHQTSVIERNLATFDKLTKQYKNHIRRLKLRVAENYIEICKLKPIMECDKITSCYFIGNNINLNPRRQVGSLVERLAHESKSKKINRLYEELQTSMNDSCSAVQLKRQEMKLQITAEYGLSIKRLQSSKFVLVETLKLFQEICNFLTDASKENEYAIISQTENDAGVVLDVHIMHYIEFLDNYSAFEHILMQKILKILKSLPVSKNLMIKNLPILSHSMAGFIYCLKNLAFKSGVTLYSNGVLLFEDKLKHQESVYSDLCQATLRPPSKFALIKLIDLHHLYEKSFYKAVINYNTSLIKIYFNEYLKHCEHEN